MRKGSTQRGFTLVELMVVVAIIAVLAVVIVPTFTRESRKAKSSTEVTPMLTELSNREQQYKQENGAYLVAAACPATPSKSLQNVTSTCLASGQPWNTLRVQPHSTQLRCSYEIQIGTAATNPSSTSPLSSATWVTNVPSAQAESWFYILAKCDANGNGTYAQYFVASWDSRTQSYNEAE